MDTERDYKPGTRFTLTVLCTLFCITSTMAEVKVAKVFSNGMVLQRGMFVPVWGTAKPGEAVTVSFRNQKKRAEANAQGEWIIRLDALRLGKPGTLTVEGENKTTFNDVLVGEVWVGSGQSNMAMPTSWYASKDPVLKKWLDETQPNVRLYTRHGWKIASTKHIQNFSALGFCFAHSLYKELDIPVGIMVSAIGAKASCLWITPDMASASNDPALRNYIQDYDAKLVSFKAALAKWQVEAKNAKAEGRKKPPYPKKYAALGGGFRAVKQFIPYAIRGVLWDQGESGTGMRNVGQFAAMSALIAGWRKAWGQGDFPFLHVQKSSGGGCAWDPKNPVNRLAVPFAKQPSKPPRAHPDYYKLCLEHVRIASIKNAPIVTASDLGQGTHPYDKSSYGKRAARVALGAVYGKDIAFCGPIYKSHKIRGSKVRVSFNHVGKGLAFRHGDKLQGFELAGRDKKWDWAKARIDGNIVVLQNEKITMPKYVRYAAGRYGKGGWVSNYANLFNKDGLPALTFSTED